jgi:SRSO17 transposase
LLPEGAVTMERRYEVRLRELMAQAVVPPEQLDGLLSRLEQFAMPFAQQLGRSEQRRNCREYLAGLVSMVERKNVESIAYLHDQERRSLQKFIGESPWDDRPLIRELAQQVGRDIGSPDGVLVFDPSSFVKKGTASVGVQRQWCGRLGKVENCQVGVYLAYASAHEHALVDVRLYLPEDWARDKQRRRKCRAGSAGSDRGSDFRIVRQRGEAERHFHSGRSPSWDAQRWPAQPALLRWIAGDDEMGRCTAFRMALRARGEQYLLAVPSNTRMRDLNVPPPPRTPGRRSRKAPFQKVCDWAAALPASAWREFTVRDGERGPITVWAVHTRAQVCSERKRRELEEIVVATRERQSDGTDKHDYYFGSAPGGASLEEFMRVAKMEHRVEECLQRAKGEAGLADYEVRNWRGWHHHQTLALLATWFLTQETRRRKKNDTGPDGAATARPDRHAAVA